MSSEKANLNNQAINALNDMINEVQPIVDAHIAKMEPAVVTYLLKNYSNYLKIDLQRDLDRARAENLTTSPFDDLFNN
jgi:hypothetical protein